MFNLEKSVADWRQQMSVDGIDAPEVLNELENHLREATAQFETTGVSGEEAFRLAVEQLGQSRDLKREFKKIDRRKISTIAFGPTVLNVFALWCIFQGAGMLSLSFRWIHHGFFKWPFLDGTWFFIFIRILMPVAYVLVGICILRRWNIGRLCGFAFCSYHLALQIWGLIFLQHQPPPLHPNATIQYLSFGIPVSHQIFLTVYAVNLAIMAWGCFLLTKNSIEKQFRPAQSRG